MSMVMGGETEYALSARRADGTTYEQAAFLSRFFAHTHALLGYTSTSTRGRFLRNGGLLYLDAGLHMEWATPEVTSPFEVVRYLEAGDRIMERALTSLAAGGSDIADVFCSRVNVDYLSRTMWAAHESYMHRAPVHVLPVELAPFLASRVLFGAGGWDVRAPALRFTMSPRAHFITTLIDRDSQFVRPLFHSKDEPHSGTGTHRLHVACGESLCSRTANVLRFGTTALVLAAIERGAAPGSEVALASPVAAVHAFAGDPEGRATATLTSGRPITALALQFHYLEHVERRLHALPFPWAEEVCVLWRRTLTELAAGGECAAATLDWGIKRALFKRCLERHGLGWSALPLWDGVLRRLQRRRARVFGDREPLLLHELLQPSDSLEAETIRLIPSLARRGLAWDQLPALVRARNEVFELDAKFAALGERGIFNTLDRAGALPHRIRELDVADAVNNPPADTRARIRGRVVQQLSEQGIRYGAEWTGIYDKDGRRELDLRNPFESEERWRALPAARPEQGIPP
jgi:hypothetical protein